MVSVSGYGCYSLKKSRLFQRQGMTARLVGSCRLSAHGCKTMEQADGDAHGNDAGLPLPAAGTDTGKAKMILPLRHMPLISLIALTPADLRIYARVGAWFRL